MCRELLLGCSETRSQLLKTPQSWCCFGPFCSTNGKQTVIEDCPIFLAPSACLSALTRSIPVQSSSNFTRFSLSDQWRQIAWSMTNPTLLRPQIPQTTEKPSQNLDRIREFKVVFGRLRARNPPDCSEILSARPAQYHAANHLLCFALRLGNLAGVLRMLS